MPPKIPSVPMPTIRPTPDWHRALEAGMQFTELRRSQARAIADDLVHQGQLARDQVSQAVDDLIEMSRRRREDVRKLVQHEVRRQLGALGLATKADLASLERRLTKVARETQKSSAKKAAAKKDTAKKAAAKSARKAG